MRMTSQASSEVILPVPTARGEDHAHVQGRHGDADDGAEAAQDGAGVVGEDLEIPSVPAATGGPRGREPETLVHARVNGALQERVILYVQDSVCETSDLAHVRKTR